MPANRFYLGSTPIYLVDLILSFLLDLPLLLSPLLLAYLQMQFFLSQLFVLFINYTPVALRHAPLYIFADDMNLFSRMKSLSDCLLLQVYLQFLAEQNNSIVFPLIIIKCSVVSICRRCTPTVFPTPSATYLRVARMIYFTIQCLYLLITSFRIYILSLFAGNPSISLDLTLVLLESFGQRPPLNLELYSPLKCLWQWKG